MSPGPDSWLPWLRMPEPTQGHTILSLGSRTLSLPAMQGRLTQRISVRAQGCAIQMLAQSESLQRNHSALRGPLRGKGASLQLSVGLCLKFHLIAQGFLPTPSLQRLQEPQRVPCWAANGPLPPVQSVPCW